MDRRNDPNVVKPMGGDLIQEPPQPHSKRGGCCSSLIPDKDRADIGPCQDEIARSAQQQPTGHLDR